LVDSSVIALVKQRKNAAFKVLYQSCINYVWSIVRRYVSNESEHADVIQEIFARVFLSIHTFDEGKGEFKFWLRRLVINQCLQHHRKEQFEGKIVPLEKAKAIEVSDTFLFNELTKEDIENYLTEMPLGYRQVFMLVVIDEYSHKEVGDLLGISAETSRSQLSRAKSWLRKKTLKKTQTKNNRQWTLISIK
jgi:RNA polymerase sigma-70 factor (ECF subfamily)